MAGTYNNIGLLDHIGFGNMGDTAIQDAFIVNIKRRLPNAHVIAFSLNPGDTTQRHNITAYPITWAYPQSTSAEATPLDHYNLASRLRSFLKRYRVFYVLVKHIRYVGLQLTIPFRELAHLLRSYNIVRSLDVLVISGGGQLSDLWKGLPYNVFKFCLLARLSSTDLFIVSVGAGPLKRPWNKVFARWSVQLANYISFRDVESQTLLNALGATGDTHIYPDPAYALNLPDGATSTRSNALMLKVGLNPMGFCDPRIWPRQNAGAYRAYLDKLAVFSQWLICQNYNLELFTSDNIVDHYALDDLKQRLFTDGPPNGAPRVVCHSAIDLKELLEQLSTFDFVVTSKFHGVVFSHLLRKPVIALSYHSKIYNLMRASAHERYCLDIEHFHVESLIQAFDSLVQNSDQLRAGLYKTVAAYGDAVQRQFDTLFSV